MKGPGAVLVISTLGIVLATSDSSCGQTRKDTFVVHPAPASKMITVTVTELRRSKHGQDKEVLIAQAAGFPNDTCDVITTFDVVKTYEERETWSNVRQRIDVVVDGKSYPAKLRDFGFYPLKLNLACIDFDSPMLRAELQIPVLPLQRDLLDSSSLSYDDGEIAKSDPGTPFLNKRGEISSVLIATPNGPLEFASSDDIRKFLKAAAAVSPWPTLHHHSLSSI
jgi:hypothetical protein